MKLRSDCFSFVHTIAPSHPETQQRHAREHAECTLTVTFFDCSAAELMIMIQMLAWLKENVGCAKSTSGQ